MKKLRYSVAVSFIAGALLSAAIFFALGMPRQNVSVGLAPSATRHLIPMKIYQQETEYSCGGATLKTLLNYYGLLHGRTESDISRSLGTGFGPPHPGTHPDRMAKFLKEEDFRVESGENGSLELINHYVNQNIPVIVLDNTWGGHWRMIIGYDYHGDKESWEDNDVFFADPEYRSAEPNVYRNIGITMENESRFDYEWYENRLFERQREKYYIVAYPPDRNVAAFGVSK